MPNQAMQNLRNKYPQYKDIDDKTLANKIVAKYPQYKDSFAEYLQPEQAETTAGQRIGQAFSTPMQTIQKGVEQSRNRNPLAGGVNIASGIMQTPFAPINAGIQAVKEIPYVGKDIGGAIEAPFYYGGKLIDLAGRGIQSRLNALGVPQSVQNMGMSPRKAKETSEAIGGLTQTVAPILFAPSIGKYAQKSAIRAGELAKKKIETGRISKASAETKYVAPPKAKELNYDQNQAIWEKYIADEYRETPIDKASPETAVRQATDMTQNVMNKFWQRDIDPINKSFGDAEIINGKEVYNKIKKDIESNEYAKDFKPEQIQATLDNAKILDKPMSPQKAVVYIKGMNSDLTNYWKKTPSEQATIDTKFGGVAGLKAVRDALADEYFAKMEESGVRGMKQARRDYGALSSMHSALERNIVRSEKVAPPVTFHGIRTSMPLGAAVVADIVAQTAGGANVGTGLLTAAGAYGLTHYLRSRATPNATIIRALGRLAKSELTRPKPPTIDVSKGIPPSGNPPSPQTGLQPIAPQGTPPPTGKPPIQDANFQVVQPKQLPPSSVPPESPKPVEPITPEIQQLIPRLSKDPKQAETQIGKLRESGIINRQEQRALEDLIDQKAQTQTSELPVSFKDKMVKELGIADASKISDAELIQKYKDAGFDKPAPANESPTSDMSVRGEANQAQVDKFQPKFDEIKAKQPINAPASVKLKEGETSTSEPLGEIESMKKSGWCGAASIKYALKEQGIDASQKQIAKLAETSTKTGTTPEEVAETLNDFGAKSRIVKANTPEEGIQMMLAEKAKGNSVIIDYLAGDNLKSDGHYVLFNKIEGDKLTFVETETGNAKTIDLENFKKHWLDADAKGKVFKNMFITTGKK
jgi:hypothetical protein